MRLTNRVADDIQRAAKANWPKECCGIVIARREDPGLGVVVLSSRNVTLRNPRRNYRLDHAVHIRAVEAELCGAAVILGYYHSHAAGPAEPSRADAELAC
ncbi:MAG: M67 family metallopeptidase, partial [Planctomycetota bacterium]